MRSLDQLSIALKWEYRFHRKDKPIAPLPNQILIDLGGKLDYGVIDTDQGGTPYQSSVEALAENPHFVIGHLLKKVNEEYAAGRKSQVDELTFSFCTHHGPGWDNMASLYVCDQLLKTGRLPKNIHWLLDASNDIAQAKQKTEGHPNRPFIIYYVISSLSDGAEEKLKSGLRLIERVIELAEEKKLSTADGENPFLEPAENFSALFPEFAEHIETIMCDKVYFEEDLKHVKTFEAELPLKDPQDSTGHESPPATSFNSIQKGYSKGKVIAFQRQPESKLFRFWIRDKKEDELLMTPFNPKNPEPKDGSTHYCSWRISVDPNMSKFNLRRLGYLLEQKETEVRRGRLERGGAPRFKSDYCDNEDPWYDGRNHHFTMVESPRCGTELSYEQIKTVITSRFHGIQLKPDKVDNLIFYFFYEIDDETKSSSELISVLDGHGFAESKPLEDLETAFQFVRDAKLRRLDVFKDQNDFLAKVWASEITRHGILELEACDFYTVAPRPSSRPLILEELNERIDELQESALQLADKLKDMLPLKNDIWGNESYRLIKMCQPNLKFRNPDRVKLVFERMLNSDLDKEQISRLMTGNSRSEDIIRTSKALCVLGDEDVTTPSDIREYREPCILYALFLKTGYRNFSQRVGTIVDDLVSQKENKPSEKESRRRLSLLQEDYSVFLGRYEFSEGEINLNRKVQAFFRKALKEMAFEEQKKETRHEMQTTYELAAARERRAFEKQNKTLQTILIWVGVLAIGDFLFSWLRTSNNPSYSTLVGALLVVALVGIAGIASRKFVE